MLFCSGADGCDICSAGTFSLAGVPMWLHAVYSHIIYSVYIPKFISYARPPSFRIFLIKKSKAHM